MKHLIIILSLIICVDAFAQVPTYVGFEKSIEAGSSNIQNLNPPTGVQIGDLLIAMIVSENSNKNLFASTDFIEISQSVNADNTVFYYGYCFHDGTAPYSVTTEFLATTISSVLVAFTNVNNTTPFIYSYVDPYDLDYNYQVGDADPTTIPALGACMYIANNEGFETIIPSGWTSEFFLQPIYNKFTFALYTRNLTSVLPIVKETGEIVTKGYRTAITLALEPQSNEPGIKVNNITTADRHKVNEILQSLINKINNK